MMVKLLGIVCILAGSTGLGLSMAQDLERRTAELQELQQIMLLLRGRIRYMHQPLPEAFRQLSCSIGKPFSRFFFQTAKELEERSGQSAAAVWEKNLKQYVPGLHISRQEYEELVKLGGMLGCLDVEMQLNLLDYYLEQLKLSAGESRENAASRRRLYRYLGLLSGMLLVLLLF